MSDTSSIAVTRTGYGHGTGGVMSKPALDKKGGVATTMHEFKHGQLHSGSKKGPKVTSRRQALAIALNSKSLTAAQRKAVPSADFAGPHDSFPIRNQTDVNSAARLSGHAANPSAVRSAIKRIAQRKGLKLPASWAEKAGNPNHDASGKFSSGGSGGGGGGTDKLPSLHGGGKTARAGQALTRQQQAEAKRQQRVADTNAKRTARQGQINQREQLRQAIARNRVRNTIESAAQRDKFRAGEAAARAAKPHAVRQPAPKLLRGNAKPSNVGAHPKLIKPASTHKEIFIFKDANGNDRWITFSSSSYLDRDQETIAQKALEQAVEMLDTTGNYGPLCWWHMNGFDNQPLVKLGDCDFSSMVGRVLVESGTFVNPTVAKAIASAARILGTSIGFIPTPSTRGPGVVFKSIVIKERSLLPDFAASNYLANKVFVGKTQPEQEVIMSKLTALKALFGGGKEADDLVAQITKEASLAEKEAAQQGLTYKQQAETSNEISLAQAILKSYGFTVTKMGSTEMDLSKKDPDILPQGDSGKKMSKQDPDLLDNSKVSGSKVSPVLQKTDADMVEEAAGAIDPMMMGQDDGMGGDEGMEPGEGDKSEYEDSTLDEELDRLFQGLHDKLDGTILQRVTEVVTPLEEALQTAISETKSTATKGISDLALVTKQVESLTKSVTALQNQLKELQGNAPQVVKQALVNGQRPGRPTSGGQLVPKEVSDQLTSTASEPDIDPYKLVAGQAFSGIFGKPF